MFRQFCKFVIFYLIHMKNYFQYIRNLQKLRKNQRVISKKFIDIISQANTPEEFAEASLIGQEEEKITKWIEKLQTTYYCNTCQDLLIPIPDKEDKDMYYQYNFDDEKRDVYILTVVGFQKIRKLIREERKEKRESIGFWIAIFFGIIGAITGLVSVLKS